MSPFWILLKQRMMEAVVTTGAISRAKLQSLPTNEHLVFLHAGCLSGHPINSVRPLKGKISHSLDLFTTSSPGVFQLCLWPLIAPGYLEGGLPCLSSALWCQYPRHVYRGMHSVTYVSAAECWTYYSIMNKCNNEQMHYIYKWCYHHHHF